MKTHNNGFVGNPILQICSCLKRPVDEDCELNGEGDMHKRIEFAQQVDKI